MGKHTVSFDHLAETVASYSPEKVEALTGVPVAELAKAAELIGTAKALVSCVLQGGVPVEPGDRCRMPGEQRQPRPR